MSYVRAWIEIARLLDRESSQPAIAPTPRGPRARRKGLQPTISSPRAPKLYGNGADRRDEPPPGAANHESDQSDRGVLRVERAHDHEPNRRFRSGESSHFRRYVHPAETRLLVARAFARPSRSPGCSVPLDRDDGDDRPDAVADDQGAALPQSVPKWGGSARRSWRTRPFERIVRMKRPTPIAAS